MNQNPDDELHELALEASQTRPTGQWTDELETMAREASKSTEGDLWSIISNRRDKKRRVVIPNESAIIGTRTEYKETLRMAGILMPLASAIFGTPYPTGVSRDLRQQVRAYCLEFNLLFESFAQMMESMDRISHAVGYFHRSDVIVSTMDLVLSEWNAWY